MIGWGGAEREGPSWLVLLLGLLLMLVFWRLMVIVAGIAAVVMVIRRLARRHSRAAAAAPPQRSRQVPPASGRKLWAAQSQAISSGGGVYLGVDERGSWQTARPERAVLVLGPPRSGKTTAVFIPGRLAHPGPAVSASTKPDVLTATGRARALMGRVWVFDPTGTSG